MSIRRPSFGPSFLAATLAAVLGAGLAHAQTAPLTPDIPAKFDSPTAGYD